MNDSYDECRSLYRAARIEEHSSQADRRAVRVGLAASIAAGIHTAAAGASATSIAAAGGSNAAVGASALGTKGIIQLLLGAKFVSEIVIGVALGTAVSTTVLVVQRTSEPTAATSSQINASQKPGQLRMNPEQRTEPQGVAPARLSTATAPQPPTEQAKAAVVAGPAVPLSRVARRNPVQVPVESAPSSPTHDGLVEETQALAQVQEALNRRDPTLAWSLLQRQEQLFPAGQLGEERAAARIMTLCAAGRFDLADRARTSFLASYPNSPLSKRVKQGCDQ